MTEMATPQLLLREIQEVKAKVFEMDDEIHQLREDFLETTLSEEERKLVVEALEDEQLGKTTSLAEMKKKLGL